MRSCAKIKKYSNFIVKLANTFNIVMRINSWKNKMEQQFYCKTSKYLLHEILLWHLNDLLVCAIPVDISDVTYWKKYNSL